MSLSPEENIYIEIARDWHCDHQTIRISSARKINIICFMRYYIVILRFQKRSVFMHL